MRKLVFLLTGSLLASGCGTARGTAHWTGPGVDQKVAGTAVGGWCPGSGTVLLEVSEEDRVAGLTWRGSPLVADSVPLNIPNPADSVATRASAAARYVYLDEVRGYRSVTGMARVTSADTLAFSATVDGRLQRVGEQDTVHFIATFDRVPLVRDETLCRP